MKIFLRILVFFFLVAQIHYAQENFREQTNGPEGGNILSITITGTNGGVLRSTDNGNNWTSVGLKLLLVPQQNIL